jgi:hypothetical protein
MKPTTVIGLLGLIVTGIIIADFVANPTGTKAVANGAVSLATPAENALLGK